VRAAADPPGPGTRARTGLRGAELLLPLLLAAVAALARVWYFAGYSRTPVFPLLPYSDGEEHFRLASAIAAGDLLGPGPFMTWPLYAYLSALLLKLSAGSAAAVYLVQHLLGVLHCVLVYHVGRRLFGVAAGAVAGLICALYAPFVFYEGLFIYNALSLLLNTLLLAAVLGLPREPGPGRAALLGLLAGAATLTQGNVLLFAVPAVAARLWLGRSGFAAFLARFAAFAAALGVLLGAVALHNRLLERDPVLLTGNLGVNFFLANAPGADGVSHAWSELTPTQGGIFRDSRVVARAELLHEPSTAEVSRFWLGRALRGIASDPRGFATLLLRKALYLVSPREILHDAEHRYLAGSVGALRAMLPDLGVVYPLAAIGMVAAAPAFRRAWPLYLALAALAASVLGFFVTAKYRVAIVPFLALFAGRGAAWIVAPSFPGTLARGAGALLLFAAFGALGSRADAVQARSGKAPAELAAIEQATVLQVEGREAEALAVLERGARERPQSRRLALALGTALFRRGDLGRAEGLLAQVRRADPLSVDAAYNLGLLYDRQGRPAEAATQLRAARDLDPADAAVRFELARALRALGDPAGALGELREALRLVGRGSPADAAVIEGEIGALEAERARGAGATSPGTAR
jgi:tetratricopeptide (TPR) repeat protein